MKTLTIGFLFLFSYSAWAGCVLESPPSWNFPGPTQTFICDTNYDIKWNDTIPTGQGLQGNLYEIISGNFVTTLFDATLLVLNGTKSVKFSCSLNESLYYQLILLETPYSPTRYDCRSKSIKITKCGNRVLDATEECEYNLESGCSGVCLCYANHTRIDDQCCSKHQVCNFNKNITLTNNYDFSDLTVNVDGILIITNNITVNLNTKIKAGCLDNMNSFIVVNSSGAKSGEVFKIIENNCSNFKTDNIDIIGHNKCLYTNTSLKNGIFEIGFSKIENCEIKEIVQKYAGLIVALVLAGVVIIIILLSTVKRLKKKVFPWRKNKHEAKDGKEEDVEGGEEGEVPDLEVIDDVQNSQVQVHPNPTQNNPNPTQNEDELSLEMEDNNEIILSE